MAAERLNEAVREHELSASWDHQAQARLLYAWFDRFNAEYFDGRLAVGFLRFDTALRTAMGYRRGCNGVGSRHEFCLNPRRLDRPLHELLAGLLHGMLHEWQELYGKPGAPRYHNRQFAARSAALGIPCPAGYGCKVEAYREPFAALLRRHEVEIVPAPPAAPAGSSLKKWSCGCQNVWGGSAVEVRCARCGLPLQRVERIRA